MAEMLDFGGVKEGGGTSRSKSSSFTRLLMLGCSSGESLHKQDMPCGAGGAAGRDFLRCAFCIIRKGMCNLDGKTLKWNGYAG